MHRVGIIIEQSFLNKVRRNGYTVPIVTLVDMWNNEAGDKEWGVFLCYPNESFTKSQYFVLVDETALLPLQPVDLEA